MKTFILGHQKPDTDAVVSALAFGHLFSSSDCWGHQNWVAGVTHPVNPETKFIFDKFQVEEPKLVSVDDIGSEDKVVLVDHNEDSQTMEGLNSSQISDIFDHHKINLNLNKPIYVTAKPWGSTCTIAWYLMDLHQVQVPRKLAALMLCGILSDTVGYKSATTTQVDKEAGEKLAKIAGIDDVEALIMEIFQAKSSAGNLTDEQVVKNDYKVYEFGKKVFIGQLETVEQEKLLGSRRAGLLTALKKIKKEEGAELGFLAVSDILKENTKLLLGGEQEKEVASKAFDGHPSEGALDIGPRLSRKKQIAPPIEKVVES